MFCMPFTLYFTQKPLVRVLFPGQRHLHMLHSAPLQKKGGNCARLDYITKLIELGK